MWPPTRSRDRQRSSLLVSSGGGRAPSSLHGRTTHRVIARLGVDPRDAGTYAPEVLWYFGRLDRARAAERLRDMGPEDEIRILSFHLVELSGRVLRKHRWINAGWAFTGLALAAAVVSLSARLLLG